MFWRLSLNLNCRFYHFTLYRGVALEGQARFFMLGQSLNNALHCVGLKRRNRRIGNDRQVGQIEGC